MDLLFGYLAGLLTLINPCVLPVLPIVLASALHRDRRAPALLAAGMGLSFVLLGTAVSAFGAALGITPDALSRASALVMAGFGAVLLVPAAGARFAAAAAGLSARADAGLDRALARGLAGQFAAGALFGAVWSPCIGPTLGGAIALASTGQGLGWAALVMTAFAAGVATVMLLLAYGTQAAIRRNRARLQALARAARPVLGATFLAVGLALWSGLHHAAEAWLVAHLPAWIIDLSVTF
jgi:cytochrome c biogenesis protein CcdA